MPSSRTFCRPQTGRRHDERAPAAGEPRQRAVEYWTPDGEGQEALRRECPAPAGSMFPCSTTRSWQKRSRCSPRRLAGPTASPELLVCARRVAEAQIDLQRVRACRHHHIERDLADPEFVGAELARVKYTVSKRWLELVQTDRTSRFPGLGLGISENPTPLEGPEKLATILSDPPQPRGTRPLRAPGVVAAQVCDP